MCITAACCNVLDVGLALQTVGAKKCVEVGVFTGYSALCAALALPEGGKLYALDVSEEWASVGKPFWKAAGVEDKIGNLTWLTLRGGHWPDIAVMPLVQSCGLPRQLSRSTHSSRLMAMLAPLTLRSSMQTSPTTTTTTSAACSCSGLVSMHAALRTLCIGV